MRIRGALIVASLVVCGSGCGDDSAGAGGTGSSGVTTGSPTTPSATGPGATAATGSVTGATSGTGAATGAGGGGGGGSTDVCSHPRPGPDNTGVPPSVTLTPSDSITVDTDGAVVEGLEIDGSITILANDVTIRNCRIHSADYYPIRYFDSDNTGLLIEDSELDSYGEDATAGISFSNYTARRLNIHGSADGLKGDENVLVEDCWIHDLGNYPGQHNDGLQSTGGKGVTLRHNDISGASNAAVQTGDEGGVPTEDMLIECNWLYGGGWTLNIRGTGASVPVNTQIIDNRFGRDAGYGPWTLDDPDPTISGNVYDDNDEPIN